MRQLLLFLKSGLREISPHQNIKSLNKNIQGDVLAGITVAIIALPLALAFGEISRLGPVAGIWGAIAGGIVGGLFGGCMVGVSGPTAPKATQIAAFMGFFLIGNTNDPDLVAAFSIIFLSGLIMIVISLLRISRFIHYTPYPVVAGFMCGIGVIVILTQINAFVGLEAQKSIHGVFENFLSTLRNTNVEALYVAVPSLVILFLWPKIERKIELLESIPAPLIALVAGTGVAYFMGLDIPYIGDKMGGAEESKIFHFYFPDLARFREFVGPAFALAGLAVLDSLLSCKVADNMTSTRHSSDRETFGQGMANMAAGLLGGVTTATATMRTVANIKFGGSTPLASIVHGLTLLAILLGLGFLVEAIPVACLAAILFKVGIDILDYRILPVLKKIPRSDLLIFVIVLSITVYADLMIAIAVGILFALAQSFKEIKSSFNDNLQHRVIRFSKSKFIKGEEGSTDLYRKVCILQPQGPLFFGSVESLMKIYADAPEHKLLIVDMSQTSKVDLSGVYSLEDIVKDCQSRGIKVVVTGASHSTKEILEKVHFVRHIGIDCYIESENSIVQLASSYR